jgi:hypothetical protein
VINDTGQRIIATNPAEAAAIKKYIKRVFNLETEERMFGILE